MKMDHTRKLVTLLIARLEKMPADSYWSHQASGLRGSLLRWLDQNGKDEGKILRLISKGFELLERAAQEK